MTYKCVDRGTDKCPCLLIEVGQCYTCGMIQHGKCDCLDGWQGVCPYTEYVQNGYKIKPMAKLEEYRIINYEIYSPTLTVITLEVPCKSWLHYSKPGAFCMLKWKEWFIPVSVLCSGDETESGLKNRGFVKFAINAEGPKTVGFLEDMVLGASVELKGPFYGGLINGGAYNSKNLSVVVAKGIALMPIINMLGNLGSNLYKFYLDKSKLPEKFIEEYLNDIEYERVNLNDNFEEVVSKIEKDYEDCLETMGQAANVFFMASPYFAHRLKDYIIEIDTKERSSKLSSKKIIMPNHSNMCCGMGICGSCSHTDENGITVRMCKCMD